MTVEAGGALSGGGIGPNRNEEQARQHKSAPDEPPSPNRAKEGDEVDKIIVRAHLRPRAGAQRASSGRASKSQLRRAAGLRRTSAAAPAAVGPKERSLARSVRSQHLPGESARPLASAGAGPAARARGGGRRQLSHALASI